MNDPMTYIAIDPGLVTGVAVMVGVPDETPKTWEVEGGINGFVDWHRWWTFKDPGPVQYFIEDWTVRPNTHKLTPQPDPYLIIGFVQGFTRLNHRSFMKIGAGEHKSFNGKGKDSKVRRIGWITETTPDGHAEDAASLLLAGLARTDRELLATLLRRLA